MNPGRIYVYCFLSFLEVAGLSLLFKTKAPQAFAAYGPEHNPFYKKNPRCISFYKTKFMLFLIRVFGLTIAAFVATMFYFIAVHGMPVHWEGIL